MWLKSGATVFRGALLDTLQTVTCVWMNKLKFVIFYVINFISEDKMMSLPNFPSCRCPQDHNNEGRNKRGRKKKKETAPISNPSRVVC